MTTAKMHADEVDVDEELVSRLLVEQFPGWAGLPVRRVESAGTDNAMFRLGDELVARLPRIPGAAAQVEKEQRWLPFLAPHLPLPVPEPVAVGRPGDRYPLPWSVLRWLDGADAWSQPLVDLEDAAVRLGQFVVALRGADATGGPRSWRGGPPGDGGEWVLGYISDLSALGHVDAVLGTAAWEETLALPHWDGRAVWLHGDLLPGNLLTRNGKLAAVVDFGGLGVGDPAAELIPAWTTFTGRSREIFREVVEVDEATWLRGRGWALRFGVGADHYYHRTNPALAEIGRRAIAAVLDDFAGSR